MSDCETDVFFLENLIALVFFCLCSSFPSQVLYTLSGKRLWYPHIYNSLRIMVMLAQTWCFCKHRSATANQFCRDTVVGQFLHVLTCIAKDLRHTGPFQQVRTDEVHVKGCQNSSESASWHGCFALVAVAKLCLWTYRTWIKLTLTIQVSPLAVYSGMLTATTYTSTHLYMVEE